MKSHRALATLILWCHGTLVASVLMLWLQAIRWERKAPKHNTSPTSVHWRVPRQKNGQPLSPCSTENFCEHCNPWNPPPTAGNKASIPSPVKRHDWNSGMLRFLLKSMGPAVSWKLTSLTHGPQTNDQLPNLLTRMNYPIIVEWKIQTSLNSGPFLRYW